VFAPLALAVLIGLAVGLAAGGRWQRLAEVRWRLAPLCLLALAVQLVLFSRVEWLVAPLVPVGPALHVLTLLLVLASLLANWRLPGLPVLILGALLNSAVIAANEGHMPRALPNRGGPLSNTALMDEATVLAPLGDWVPGPFPPGALYSPGDVLIGLGGGLAAYRIVRGHREGAAP
jgi:hypothetical protein